MPSNEPVTRLPSQEEELIEEALAEVFKQIENGQKQARVLRENVDGATSAGVFEKLRFKGLVTLTAADAVEFSPEGERTARAVIRRCRLSERLLSDVLNVRPESINAAACQFEHVLTGEVADSICTLLGHPTRCPHENPIPRGQCCEKAGAVIRSVVVPLDRLESSREAVIAYLLFKKNPELYRVLSLGLIPGSRVRLIQRVPTFVVEVGTSQLAFDQAIARDIYVRPL